MSKREIEIENNGYNEIHGGAGQCNIDLLAWIVGHFFQRSDTANRQQCDTSSANAVAAGGQRMTEFMQDHTTEQHQNISYTGNDRLDGALLVPVTDAHQVNE